MLTNHITTAERTAAAFPNYLRSCIKGGSADAKNDLILYMDASEITIAGIQVRARCLLHVLLSPSTKLRVSHPQPIPGC